MSSPSAERMEDMNTLPTIDMVATGKKIDRLRRNARLSVRELQLYFGFSTPQAIYKWIHGAALPTLDNLVILADVLEVSIDEIVVTNKDIVKIHIID